ncbi:MAG: asparagine synthase (glutamine-hydrolyzing) [Bacteroidia bacterium]
MCGIFAHIKNTSLTQQNLIDALTALSSINHRGPDGDGLILINSNTNSFQFINSGRCPNSINAKNINDVNPAEFNIILGHKRLSIFDLSDNGFQPMICKQTGNIIVFNGEIYNWKQIREELKNINYPFTSETDTEVILAAYKTWGEKCVERFNGMWAFVIYDAIKRNCFISRDRFGVKPLFYAQQNSEIILASEVKQYLHFKNLIGEYNLNLMKFYLEESIICFNNDTFFTNLFRFPVSSNCILSLKNLQLNFTKYYTLNTTKLNLSTNDAISEFRFLLNDAIKLRLAADVPVGVAISGGLDSSSILALAYEQLKIVNKSHLLNTFSVVARGEEGDESKHIDELLKHYNCKNNFVSILDEFSTNDLREHLFMHDYPAVTSSFYADYCLSKLIKSTNTTVVLNGQGADEVFAGYHHHFYKYAASLLSNLKYKLYKEELNSFVTVKGLNKEKVSKAIQSELKYWLKAKVGKSYKNFYDVKNRWLNSKNLSEQLYIDLFEYTIPNYLASNDRNTMAFSLESRHPFMDYRLIDFGFKLKDSLKIKNGFQKHIIREAMVELPDNIRWRKDKMGFTTPENKVLRTLQNENAVNKSILKDYGIDFKEDYKYYSLAIWFEKYKPNK